MAFTEPCLKRGVSPAGERVGVPLLYDNLDFLAGRARPNTVLAAGYDVLVFFRFVAKEPAEITSADVLAFITAQRSGGAGRSLRAVRDAAGVSARTVRRRLSTISGLFSYLTVRGEVMANPVPRGLPTRRELSRPRQGVPLVRSPRTLPRVLEAAEVDALLAAASSHRDRAMFQAMVLGGLRRCEVLGLRGAGQVFIAQGKGGHQRQDPVSGRFFTSVGAYLDTERPAEASTGKVFVALKVPAAVRRCPPPGSTR